MHEVSAVDFWELQTSVVGIKRQLRQLKVCFTPPPPVASLTQCCFRLTSFSFRVVSEICVCGLNRVSQELSSAGAVYFGLVLLSARLVKPFPSLYTNCRLRSQLNN